MYRRAALLAFAFLQAALVVAAAALEEPCATAGATRCDEDARVLSVCDAHGRWARVDCASQGGACLDGRCALPNATRAAETCDPAIAGTPKCSSDCTGIELCTNSGIYVLYQTCPSTEGCDDSSPNIVCKTNGVCSQTVANTVKCESTGYFPVIQSGYCNQFYTCSNVGDTPSPESCLAGKEFDPCTRLCVDGYTGTCSHSYTQCGAATIDQYPVSSNPTMYYFCVLGQITWHTCASGSYYSMAEGKCVSGTVSCGGGGGGIPGSCSCASYGNCVISGTTCYYCRCPSGGSCGVIKCADEYYFDTTAGRCLKGNCS